MGRKMPTECEHGRILDWGDFAPSDEAKPEECPDCQRVPEEAFVWVSPARMGGTPCIGFHRLPTEQIASLCWHHGIDEVFHGWGYLTRAQVLVACWFEWASASYRKTDPRRTWADAAALLLWHADDEHTAQIPDPPTKPTRKESSE